MHFIAAQEVTTFVQPTIQGETSVIMQCEFSTSKDLCAKSDKYLMIITRN
jgi:hypothetical protein